MSFRWCWWGRGKSTARWPSYLVHPNQAAQRPPLPREGPNRPGPRNPKRRSRCWESSPEAWRSATRWTRQKKAWAGLPPGLAISLYFQQAWALVQYLEANHSDALDATYAAVIDRDRKGHATVMHVFQKAMALDDEDDWAALQETFEDYVRNELLQ